MPYGFKEQHRSALFGRRPLRPVLPEGPVPARVYLIGERLGESEAVAGRPFVGISGKYLDLCLQAAAVDRSDCRINNLVSTFSFYTKPTQEEINRDHDALVADILDCAPDIIGLVGGWAVEHVLLRAPEMEKCHGVPVRVPSLFGDELYRDQGWVVLPILHPASAAHSPDSLPMVLDDILTLGKLIDGEIQPMREDSVYNPDYRIVNCDDLEALLP